MDIRHDRQQVVALDFPALRAHNKIDPVPVEGRPDCRRKVAAHRELPVPSAHRFLAANHNGVQPDAGPQQEYFAIAAAHIDAMDPAMD